MQRNLSVLVGTLVLVATIATGAGAPPAGTATAQSTCSFPVERTDATGTTVRIDSEPKRIVTLAPSAAQTMWDIGGREKVVGVSQYASYLDGSDERTNVSGAGEAFVSVETVVALEPDLVLAPQIVPNETVEKLRSAGLTVYRFREATSIGFVVEKTRLTGRLTGECAGADATADRMTERLQTVREAVADEPRPRAMYVFFGFTAGEGTFIDEIVTTAGGRNVASEAGITGYREYSPETVVDRNPEWILLNEDQPTVPQTDAFNATTAVERGNVVVLNRSYISQPAPRIVRSVVKLAKAFHPEAYAAANATATPTQTPVATPDLATASAATPSSATTSTASPDTTGEPSRTETPTDAPGFGPGVAVAALLATLGLLARRVR
jgi:iron complex transport system substrate-binding protein